MPNEAFRTKVLETGMKAVDIVAAYLNGVAVPAAKLRAAGQVLIQAVKVDHMDQLREQQNVSNGFRLAGFLRDTKDREKFMEVMRPRIASEFGRPELPAAVAPKAPKK